MPRGTKALRRQKINAGLEYKKGNREEAYKLWSKAAASYKERLAGKKNKKAAKAAEGASE